MIFLIIKKLNKYYYNNMIIKKVKDVIQGKATVKHKRSSHWPTVRKHHLEKNPTCAVCGGTEKIEVHHIQPFHVNPELELEPSNLVSLCESKSFGIVCHLLIGHLGSYKKVNPDVIKDAETWNKKIKGTN